MTYCQLPKPAYTHPQYNSVTQYHVFAHGQDIDLGQSPTIHGLTKDDFMHSSDPKQTFAMLSRALNDAVMVCHHKGMDWGFLKQVEKAHDIPMKPLAVFDTLAFEKKQLEKTEGAVRKDSLTLSSMPQTIRTT